MTQKRALDYAIRAATADDMRAIEMINRYAWSGGITTHELLEQRHGLLNDSDWRDNLAVAVQAHLARPDVTTFVAELEESIIGFAAAQMALDQGVDIGTVSYNAVAPEFRGLGVGTALIQHVIDFLLDRGARVLNVVTIDGDTTALRLYERLGFRKLTRLVLLSRDAQ